MSSFLPESLDVAAGLVFVYLFMSVLATVAREAFEGFVKGRSKNLEKGLVELLCDHPPEKKVRGAKEAPYEYLKAFYDHPLIMSLYRGRYVVPTKRSFFQRRHLPSYIPSSHFAYVLLDLLSERGGQTSPGTLDLGSVLGAANGLGNKRLARMVQFAVNNSGGDIEQARRFLENWFNATMDRVSGWYRLETQTILFWVSLITCVVLNVNTVVIADSLYRSPSLRKAVEARAEAYYAQASAAAPNATPGFVQDSDKLSLNQLTLPLGWNAQTQEEMSRLFSRHKPIHIDVPADDATKTPKTFFGFVQSTWSNLWTNAEAFYYGQPVLGEDTFVNAAAFLTLIMGWVMTAFAVTLGAPFWFDVLSKLMVVRSTLKPGGSGGGAPADLSKLTASPLPASDGAPELSPYVPANVAVKSAPSAASDDDPLPAIDPFERPRNV